MNKLEQVSSDHHQMSLTGGRSPGLRSRAGGGEAEGERGTYFMM